MIYLDNAATTKACHEAIGASAYAMSHAFGNPSSLHGLGIEAENLINYSKEQIACVIGASADEITFTSGATEANNLAVLGLANVYGKRRRKVVTTAVEHPSVTEPMKILKDRGFNVITVSPDADGNISEDALVNAVDDQTCLISAMLVNNETGYVLPIERAFSRIKKLYPLCMTHCDCVQAFLKLPIKAKSLSVDTLSVSAHKIHGPKGIGALYVKKGVRLTPQIYGGGQQDGIRSGTEAVPAIYAFGKTCETFSKTVTERLEHAAALKAHLISKVSEIDGAVINSSDGASPYIISLAVPGIKSETILHFLESKGIYVSSGSACSKGKKSSVLEAFKLPDSITDSTVRISTSASTEINDIDALIEGLKEAASTLIRTNKR